MQPELPWNLVGIPPEAREAARAAARREGLSIGEWLTRRIVQSFADGEQPTWHQSAYRAVEESMSPPAPSRETDDMLAHVSRTENDAQNAYRRIEEQLRGMARRLEQTERSHSENSRAMSKAATEINIASREQSQAFDQLGAQVMNLADRLGKVERAASADPLRDAVKGLHQGLGRLADQISQTANQSATQIASLATNVEALAGKLEQTDAGARALEQRVASVDERVRPVERAGDTMERLSARLAAAESETHGAIARIEESVSQVAQRANGNAAVDRRLQSIENALADIMGRLDHAEHNTSPSPQIEENLRRFSAQLAESEQRQREAITEIRAGLREAAAKIEAAPVPLAAPAPPQQQPAQAAYATPQFDLPPFPDVRPAAASAPIPGFQAPPPDAFPSTGFASGAFDVPPPPFDGAPGFDPHAFAGEPHADAGDFLSEPGAGTANAESFLAAARRSARAAATAKPERTARAPAGAFTTGATRPGGEAKSSGKTRYVLIAVIVILALAAGMASVLLSQGTQQSKPVVVPKPPQAAAPPVTAPGYEAVPPATDTDGDTMAPQEVIPAPVKPVPDTKQAAPAASAPPAGLAAAANAGNPRAQLALGMKYLDGDGVPANEAEAARWLERAAKQGQPVAEYRLGTLYERGHGVPANAGQAIAWYTQAANAGNRKAMHNLAAAYAEGTKKDYAQAAKWFTKAASLGLADSQFNLAVLYERGMGVPQSLVNAYKWYAIAAAAGDSEAKSRVDALSTQLSAADQQAAQQAAAAFKPQPLNAAANVPPMASEFGGN